VCSSDLPLSVAEVQSSKPGLGERLKKYWHALTGK
jgi:hypothetical protein